MTEIRRSDFSGSCFLFVSYLATFYNANFYLYCVLLIKKKIQYLFLAHIFPSLICVLNMDAQ